MTLGSEAVALAAVSAGAGNTTAGGSAISQRHFTTPILHKNRFIKSSIIWQRILSAFTYTSYQHDARGS